MKIKTVPGFDSAAIGGDWNARNTPAGCLVTYDDPDIGEAQALILLPNTRVVEVEDEHFAQLRPVIDWKSRAKKAEHRTEMLARQLKDMLEVVRDLDPGAAEDLAMGWEDDEGNTHYVPGTEEATP